ncbi:recombinase family protein [Enterobacter mori]|uniref:recombinase family protein n=1 Tax=Enterobacter mori TaxID=539813 RepID=UPI003B843429
MVAIDRLSCNTIDVLSTVEAIRAKGVKLISLHNGFELSTPAGQMMMHMMAGFAEMETSIIAARREAGLHAPEQKGGIVAGPSLNTSLCLPGGDELPADC